MTHKNVRRVIYISPIFEPGVGGAARYFGLVSRMVGATGISVWVLSSRPRGAPWFERLEGTAVKVLRILPCIGGMFGWRHVKGAIRNVIVVAAVVAAPRETTVLHFHNSVVNEYLSRMLMTLGRRRLVLDVRDEIRIPRSDPFTCIISVSPSLLDRFPPLPSPLSWSQRAYVLPLPLNPEVWKAMGTWCPSTRLGSIVFIGAKTKSKGLDVLLDAFQEVREKYAAGVSLRLIGPAGNVNVSRRLEGVTDLGAQVSVAEVVRELQMNTVLALPSGMEAMPRSILEGIVVGIPVVFSGSELLHERLPTNQTPSTSEGLAAVLMDALTEPQRFVVSRSRISDFVCTDVDFMQKLWSIYRET